MPLLEEEYRKEEKINGVIYDMSPSPNYQHGLVDGNIYSNHINWFTENTVFSIHGESGL